MCLREGALRERERGHPGGQKPEPLTVARASALEAPADLPPEAVEVWEWLIGRLGQAGILDLVDRPALIAMCVQWARDVVADQVIASEGPFRAQLDGAAGRASGTPDRTARTRAVPPLRRAVTG